MITAIRSNHPDRMLAGSVVRLACLLLAVCLVSCRQVDFGRMRREHARQFPAEMSDKTLAALSGGQPAGLADCVRIALANNLDVQTARIHERLAGLDRKIAFSNFLPHIDVGVTYTSADKQQAIRTGAGYSAMSDRSTTRAVISAQQSIFAPETWFLYDAFKKGEGISELVARRTRDLVRLQVASLYFACLSQEKAERVVEHSLEQARVLLKELDALHREGLAMSSQVKQVRTLVMSQKVALAENRRLQRETKSDLLEAMGLSPMGTIMLKAEAPLIVPEQGLPDQVLQAMLQRPELHIADRAIEIRKDETRIAIAQFLPKIMGFGDLVHTSDSFLKYSNTFTFGVSGVLSVFDGFANIYEYKAAKEQEKKAAISREQSCMRIMLEVIRARSNYEQAKDQQDVAKQELAASQALFEETEARWREGLLQASEKLGAVTRHTAARANVSIAEFRHQVAAATLLAVMGVSTEGNLSEKTN